MKNLYKTLFIIMFFVWFGNLMLDQYADNAREDGIRNLEHVQVPEPGRPHQGWNWETNTYLYDDQIPPRQKFNDNNQSAPLPDYYVEDINKGSQGTGNKIDRPTFMYIDGKRYSILYRSNGRIELTLDD